MIPPDHPAYHRRAEALLLLLSPLQREVWRLHSQERMFYVEIARYLRIDTTTANAALCKARRIMNQVPKGQKLRRITVGTNNETH